MQAAGFAARHANFFGLPRTAYVFCIGFLEKHWSYAHKLSMCNPCTKLVLAGMGYASEVKCYFYAKLETKNGYCCQQWPVWVATRSCWLLAALETKYLSPPATSMPNEHCLSVTGETVTSQRYSRCSKNMLGNLYLTTMSANVILDNNVCQVLQY